MADPIGFRSLAVLTSVFEIAGDLFEEKSRGLLVAQMKTTSPWEVRQLKNNRKNQERRLGTGTNALCPRIVKRESICAPLCPRIVKIKSICAPTHSSSAWRGENMSLHSRTLPAHGGIQ
jgi:hypothetical protein